MSNDKQCDDPKYQDFCMNTALRVLRLSNPDSSKEHTTQLVKKTYNVLSQLWHPDHCSGYSKESCETQMSYINSAWQIYQKYGT